MSTSWVAAQSSCPLPLFVSSWMHSTGFQPWHKEHKPQDFRWPGQLLHGRLHLSSPPEQSEGVGCGGPEACSRGVLGPPGSLLGVSSLTY